MDLWGIEPHLATCKVAVLAVITTGPIVLACTSKLSSACNIDVLSTKCRLMRNRTSMPDFAGLGPIH